MINYCRDVVDKLYDEFRHGVARCSLSSKHTGTRSKIIRVSLPHAVVQNYNVECVQELPLILVDTFHLYIEETIRVNHPSMLSMNVIGKLGFSLPLHPFEGLAKTGIINMVFKVCNF